MNYREIAEKVIERHFPKAQGAIMAGSIVRGQGTPTSDIDLIIIDETLNKGYRTSLMMDQVPVEVFAHNRASIKHYSQEDYKAAMPSLPNMLVEGQIIREHPILENLVKEARALLEKGPAPLTNKEKEDMRYFITDLMEDLKSAKPEEVILIAYPLLYQLQELYLLARGAWIGKGKWLLRALAREDEEMASRFEEVLRSLPAPRGVDDLIELANDILSPFGGTLFAGYTRGKE